jgi:hypothetical protein
MEERDGERIRRKEISRFEPMNLIEKIVCQSSGAV